MLFGGMWAPKGTWEFRRVGGRGKGSGLMALGLGYIQGNIASRIVCGLSA